MPDIPQEPAARPAQVFKYKRPELKGRSKSFQILGKTDISVAIVQRITSGGENNLHSHVYQDGYWFVLGGRARFYTTGDEVIADLGVHEGILVPRGFPYWFESSGDEDLEMLQFEASALANFDVAKDRVDHTPRKLAAMDPVGDN
jgi:mannose-6-phosphate isomerase-like protein (cupin superfamily)